MTASSDTYSGYDHIEPFRCQRAYPKDNYLPFIRLLNYIFVITHLIANLNFFLLVIYHFSHYGTAWMG